MGDNNVREEALTRTTCEVSRIPAKGPHAHITRTVVAFGAGEAHEREHGDSAKLAEVRERLEVLIERDPPERYFTYRSYSKHGECAAPQFEREITKEWSRWDSARNEALRLRAIIDKEKP